MIIGGVIALSTPRIVIIHFIHCEVIIVIIVGVITLPTAKIVIISAIHFERATLCARGTSGPSRKLPPISYCPSNSENIMVGQLLNTWTELSLFV